MVLSNKKLKQKIREDLVKSLSVSVAETNPDSVSNLQSQSLKELLDSASHKPRFSKREKRRKTETFSREDQPIDGIHEKTDKKKRKRDEEEGTNEGEKPKKKNKKKKKKRKANKTPKKDNVEDKVKVEEIQVNTEIKEEGEDGVVPNKLYVGGIPYQSTEDEIRSYFRSCGVITKVDCKMRPEDGAFTGIAFITFQSEDGAKRALAFDRAAMGDRFLTIQQYVKTTPSIPKRNTSSGFAPKMVDGYNRVYIGNLAWDTTERDIQKLFSDCVINSVRLGKNKETGEFKGYAHVDFKDSVSVAIALKLDQQVICGRPVKICCALKERPATDPTPDETNNAGSYNNEEETLAVPNEGNYFTPMVSTGKVKRRVCYECGEKGHLSTACPKKLQNADDQTNSKFGQETLDAGLAKQSYGLQKNSGDSYYMNERYAATDEANNGSLASTVSTGKIKRRSCYECGEKGHLSTACPKKLQNTSRQTVETGPIQVTSYSLENRARETENNVDSYYMNEKYAATDEANNGSLASAVSTGKIKRRSCYECGEKGHLSTACPKKLQNADDQTNSKFGQETLDAGLAKQSYGLQKNSGDSYYMNERYAATDEANNGSLASTVSTGKIKRRSCYECGEKGHLSTACPKKLQNTAHTNQKLDHQTVETGPIQVTSYSLEKRARDTENNGVSYMDETYATGLISADVTNEANDGNLASTVSTGKIKRRNCYECGEKGHLSSACPKKQQKQG